MEETEEQVFEEEECCDVPEQSEEELKLQREKEQEEQRQIYEEKVLPYAKLARAQCSLSKSHLNSFMQRVMLFAESPSSLFPYVDPTVTPSRGFFVGSAPKMVVVPKRPAGKEDYLFFLFSFSDSSHMYTTLMRMQKRVVPETGEEQYTCHEFGFHSGNYAGDGNFLYLYPQEPNHVMFHDAWGENMFYDTVINEWCYWGGVTSNEVSINESLLPNPQVPPNENNEPRLGLREGAVLVHHSAGKTVFFQENFTEAGNTAYRLLSADLPGFDNIVELHPWTSYNSEGEDFGRYFFSGSLSNQVLFVDTSLKGKQENGGFTMVIVCQDPFSIWLFHPSTREYERLTLPSWMTGGKLCGNVFASPDQQHVLMIYTTGGYAEFKAKQQEERKYCLESDITASPPESFLVSLHLPTRSWKKAVNILKDIPLYKPQFTPPEEEVLELMGNYDIDPPEHKLPEIELHQHCEVLNSCLCFSPFPGDEMALFGALIVTEASRYPKTQEEAKQMNESGRRRARPTYAPPSYPNMWVRIPFQKNWFGDGAQQMQMGVELLKPSNQDVTTTFS